MGQWFPFNKYSPQGHSQRAGNYSTETGAQVGSAGYSVLFTRRMLIRSKKRVSPLCWVGRGAWGQTDPGCRYRVTFCSRVATERGYVNPSPDPLHSRPKRTLPESDVWTDVEVESEFIKHSKNQPHKRGAHAGSSSPPPKCRALLQDHQAGLETWVRPDARPFHTGSPPAT